jgi:hypothetical protein
MYGKSLPMVKIDILQKIDNEVVAEVSCHDYDVFCALPDALEIDGVIFGKTGWSSDRNYACYKTNVLLGVIR